MAVKADRDCDSETQVTYRDTAGDSAPSEGICGVYNDAAIEYSLQVSIAGIASICSSIFPRPSGELALRVSNAGLLESDNRCG